MTIVYWKVRDLRPSEYNPRQMTERQAHDLRASIREFGLVDPLIVNVHPDRYGVVVGGHRRLDFSAQEGMEEVPCVEVNLPLNRERELNIRLNKNTGEWDMDALSSHFDLDELTAWGFEEWELGVQSGKPQFTVDAAAKDGTGEAYDDTDMERSHVRMVQLYYTSDEQAEVLRLCEVLQKRYATDNTSDTVLHALREITDAEEA